MKVRGRGVEDQADQPVRMTVAQADRPVRMSRPCSSDDGLRCHPAARRRPAQPRADPRGRARMLRRARARGRRRGDRAPRRRRQGHVLPPLPDQGRARPRRHGGLRRRDGGVRRARRRDGRPLEGLREYLVEHNRLQAENTGFFDAMAARFSEGENLPARLLDRSARPPRRPSVLEPARRAGLVREGVEAGDDLDGDAEDARRRRSARCRACCLQRGGLGALPRALLSGIRAGQDAAAGHRRWTSCAMAREVRQMSA